MTDAAIEAAPEPETPACAPGVELPRIQRCLQPPSGAKPPGLERGRPKGADAKGKPLERCVPIREDPREE